MLGHGADLEALNDVSLCIQNLTLSLIELESELDCAAEDQLTCFDSQNEYTPLLKASFMGEAQAVEMLIDWGADVGALNAVSGAAACCRAFSDLELVG